ncbi:4Fe-4S dicluster domain-containing protein [Candidatus Hydrogenedentota bacterium]
MKWKLDDKALHSEFLKVVEKLSGQNVSDCYQCGKCSGGCPVVEDVTVSPNKAIRMVQLGLEEDALNNEMVWNCAGCGTCNSRCPEEVDIVAILDVLRLIAEKKGKTKAKGAMEVRTFYRAFLDCVRDFGRLSEVGLMAGYNINSGRLFTNVIKAPWFLFKNKVSFKAHKIDKLDRLQRVFDRIEKIEQSMLDDLGENK